MDKDSGEWNGIMKDILDGEADISASSLGVTELRARYVPFSLPIKREQAGLFISKELSVQYKMRNNVFLIQDSFQ